MVGGNKTFTNQVMLGIGAKSADLKLRIIEILIVLELTLLLALLI